MPTARNEVAHGPFPVTKHFEHTDPRRVTECLEELGLHLVDRSGHGVFSILRPIAPGRWLVRALGCRPEY